ncbi:hypothetical protein D3C84_1212950 [compost metagenome]
MKLLVYFVTANVSQIVTFWIEESSNKQALRIIQCRRLARTKAFINLDQRFLGRICVVFIQRVANILVMTEQF